METMLQKNYEEYLHLDEVQDHDELRFMILQHFHHSENKIDTGTYKYQEKGSSRYIEIQLDDNKKIKKVKFSRDFPEEDLKKIELSIQDALLSERVEIGQEIIFCHEKVTGFFRYKDKFQILPIAEELSIPKFGGIEFPFLIQFNYNSSSNPFIDTARRKKQAIIYTRILNLLINQRLRINRDTVRMCWVMEVDEDENKVDYSYKQEGFGFDGMKSKLEDFSDTSMLSEIKKIFFQDYYSKVLGITDNPLAIPDNLEKSIDIILSLDDKKWKKFFMSCSWYYQSPEISLGSVSSSFIALVTALECLVGIREKCDRCSQDLVDKQDFCNNCSQPRYRVNKNFKEFLKKFFPSIDNFPREKKVLYDIRSQLAHGVNLLQGDLEPWKFIMDAKKDDQSLLHRNLHFISRIAIYNWLWISAKED